MMLRYTSSMLNMETTSSIPFSIGKRPVAVFALALIFLEIFVIGKVTAADPGRLKAHAHELKNKNKSVRIPDLFARNNEIDRASLNKQLKNTAYAVQNIEQRLTKLETKLKELNKKQIHIRSKLTAKKNSISKLLAAAQRISRNPPPVIVTHRSDALSMVRGGMQLRYLFPKFHGTIEELRKKLVALSSIINTTKIAKANTLTEEKRLKNEQNRLAVLLEAKKNALMVNGQNFKKLRQTINFDERNISSLNERILRNNKVIAENTKLGSYERKQNKFLGTSDAIDRLSPFSSGRAVNHDRLEPAVPFHMAKAQLPIPARGPLVVNYGDRTPNGGRSNGIVIKTRHRAAVTSPCDGWIVYAGAFRSYGQLLIINAGNGYHVLLANLSRLDVQLGQFVLVSEPVGAMVGIDRHNARPTNPLLLVEFRKNGKPIDPNPWWIKNNKDRMQS
ncbi:MAG: peptidoglycan DD-metalloendopeptidase family protein [Hyphomicrobiaceae bacterium]|nr:peptidoglycan DD-metalloendopeptidase family protein [Hyphomicrobiaceae bacterium]